MAEFNETDKDWVCNWDLISINPDITYVKNIGYLEELFNAISLLAHTCKPNHGGLARWKALKDCMPDKQIEQWKFRPTLKSLIFSQLTPVTNDVDKPDEIEAHHFLRQHARIPMTKDPTLITILQVAYNIGQWIRVKDYDTMIKMNYFEHKLNCLSTYVLAADIDKLSKMITREEFNIMYDCIILQRNL